MLKKTDQRKDMKDKMLAIFPLQPSMIAHRHTDSHQYVYSKQILQLMGFLVRDEDRVP